MAVQRHNKMENTETMSAETRAGKSTSQRLKSSPLHAEQFTAWWRRDLGECESNIVEEQDHDRPVSNVRKKMQVRSTGRDASKD